MKQISKTCSFDSDCPEDVEPSALLPWPAGEDEATPYGSCSSFSPNLTTKDASQSQVCIKRKGKKTQFSLNSQDEQLMCEFLRNNPILWDSRKIDFRRVDKKAIIWENQAKIMGKTAEHLQGWYRSLRDTNTRLHKKNGSSGASKLTEREEWVKSNLGFLNNVVRHRASETNNATESEVSLPDF